jgi:hypothetical protein
MSHGGKRSDLGRCEPHPLGLGAIVGIQRIVGADAQIRRQHARGLALDADADAIDEEADARDRGDGNREREHQHGQAARAKAAEEGAGG